MIPWVQVYSNLPQHPKIGRLADELGQSKDVEQETVAVGIVVSLWTWAIQNAYTGDLSGVSDRAIARACGWRKDAGKLVTALISAGWLDEDRHIHDWEEYSVLLLAQEDNRREKTAERVRRYRNRQRIVTDDDAYSDDSVTGNADDTECNALQTRYGNVTDTPCNAPTIPNHTIPNLTKPKDIVSGGGDARAREDDPPKNVDKGNKGARSRDEAKEEILAKLRSGDPKRDDLVRRIQLGDWDDAPETLRTEITQITADAFRSFCGRAPTDMDRAAVLRFVTEDGRVDGDRRDLMLYALEAANKAGKPGQWAYINGVLGKLIARGVRTLEQAQDYDDFPWAREQ